MPTPTRETARPEAAAKRGFRPDVQGLRAIAVLLVVLYHSGVETLSGGYVGVDVFFVISGFLITTHLLQMHERDGRISFGAFYAKRARRILPAALLVAALSTLAAWIWMSPLLMGDVVRGAVATALYVPNYHFAASETDYLSDDTPSVFQHYWSLGIEEQFYLFWPAILALGFWWLRRSERRVLILTAVLTALSFAAGVVMLDIAQPWAFFSLPTRAWELGVGGLVAFLLRSGVRWLHFPLTGLLAWAGLAGLALVALGFDAETPFPGWTAALPVLATAAMIIGGAAPGRLHATALLSLRPLQFVGAISYSLYLVHWPLQVIPHAATFADAPLPLWQRLALGAIAVPIAWLLYRFVERPVIGWSVLRERRQRLTGALALAASLAVIATAVGVHQVSAHKQLAVDRPAEATAQQQDPAGTGFVPENLTTDLRGISGDYSEIYDNGCHLDGGQADPSGCLVGEDEEAPLVFLFGDSHAASWYPALEKLAEDGKIRLDTNTKSSCLPLAAEQQYLGEDFTDCEQWRDGVLQRIDEDQPDLVILASYHSTGRLKGSPGQDSAAKWREGLEGTLEQIDGPRVAVMRDVPTQARKPDQCLSKNLADAEDCSALREEAIKPEIVEAEDQAITEAREEAGTEAKHVDLTEYFCNDDTCPTVIGNTVVFRDTHHLTESFGRTMAEPLWEEIGPMVS